MSKVASTSDAALQSVIPEELTQLTVAVAARVPSKLSGLEVAPPAVSQCCQSCQSWTLTHNQPTPSSLVHPRHWGVIRAVIGGRFCTYGHMHALSATGRFVPAKSRAARPHQNQILLCWLGLAPDCSSPEVSWAVRGRNLPLCCRNGSTMEMASRGEMIGSQCDQFRQSPLLLAC